MPQGFLVRLCRAAAFLPLIGLAACSNSATTVRLHGRVTLDGDPLATGMIIFTPQDPTFGPETGGNIVNGVYEVPADRGATPGGDYLIRITAMRPSGRMIQNPFDPNGPPLDEDEQFIPPRYNSATELLISTTTGENQFDFDLMSDTNTSENLLRAEDPRSP